jgi:hypothetical protein
MDVLPQGTRPNNADADSIEHQFDQKQVGLHPSAMVLALGVRRE